MLMCQIHCVVLPAFDDLLEMRSLGRFPGCLSRSIWVTDETSFKLGCAGRNGRMRTDRAIVNVLLLVLSLYPL